MELSKIWTELADKLGWPVISGIIVLLVELILGANIRLQSKSVMFWFVAQVATVASGAIWFNEVRQYPVISFIVFLSWEILVALVIAASNFGRAVWKEEFEKVALQSSAEWAWTAFGNLRRTRKRYNQQLIYDHRTFNVKGLRTRGTYTVELDQVFVDLKIAPANPQDVPSNPLTTRTLIGKQPIWAFLRAFADKPAQALAIVGPPGCGKTTLLQHLALMLASNRQRRYKVRAYIPLFLFLRDHVAAITGERPPSLATLADTVFREREEYRFLTPNWFKSQLRRRCLVLLDGLDEVANAEQRVKVAKWVDQQIIAYPDARFVLTARPQGYSSASLTHAHVLEVQPFTIGQVKAFVENWYLVHEVLARGKDDTGVQQAARKGASDLLQRLQRRPALSALTSNPLLLTMVTMVHRYRGALPGRRVELYAEICDVLLEHWRAAVGVQDTLSAAQKRAVLQPLAATMMIREVRDISTRQALALLTEPLAEVNITGNACITFLADLQASSGLVLEREPGMWSFAHQTFQEYLCAAHWVEHSSNIDWEDLVEKSWWAETLRLFAAQSNATSLVQTCLNIRSITSLTLAAECVEEARTLAQPVRAALEELLEADLESPEPARQRLAGQVRLARRLRNMQPVDERHAIDPHPITCAEYQLFLDDMYAEGKSYYPDQRQGLRFAAGSATAPIQGIRGEDAAAFCTWLTERESGSIYRLPTYEEIQRRRESTPQWYRSTIKLVVLGPVLLGGIPETLRQVIRHKLDHRSELPFPAKIDRLVSGVDIFIRAFFTVNVYSNERVFTSANEHARERVLTRTSVRGLTSDLARVLANDPDDNPYFDLSRTRERVRQRTRSSTRKRAQSSIRDHNLVSSLARSVVNSRAHELTLIRTISSDLAHLSVNANDLPNTIVSTRARVSARQLSNYLNYASERTRASTSTNVNANASGIASILADNLRIAKSDLKILADLHAITSNFALDIVLIVTSTQLLALYLNNAELGSISAMLASVIQENIQTGAITLPILWKNLIDPLLGMAQATDLSNYHHAQWIYWSELTALIWKNYIHRGDNSRWYHHFIPHRRNVVSSQQEAVLAFHWWCQLQIACVKGLIQPVDYLYIVAERKI